MKKIVFVLGILGTAFTYIAEGSIPPGEKSVPPLKVVLPADCGSTPPVTVRTIELTDDSSSIEQLRAQITALQRQMLSLSSGVAAELSSQKEQTKKAASAESVYYLSQLIGDRFEKQNRSILELMKNLSDLSARMDATQTRGKVGTDGLERLNYIVDRRLNLQNLHIRMSMVAFNELSSEVAKMKSEIARLSAQNERLQQQVADLTKKLADSKQK